MAPLARRIAHTGIFLKKTKQAEEQTWRRDEVKCRAPAQMNIDQSAQYVTKRAPDRNCREKHCEHATARRQGEKIRNDWRSRGTVSAFANTNKDARDEKCCDASSESGGAARETPENDCAANDHPPRKAIGQPAQCWRGDHVAHDKRGAKRAGDRHCVRIARREKSRTNRRFHRGQDVPVDIIKEINSEEQCERSASASSGLLDRHGIVDCSWQRAYCKP